MSFNKEKKVIHSLRTQVDSFGRKKYRLQQVIQSGGQESQNEVQNNTVVDTGRHKSMLIGREQGLNIDKYIGKIDTNKKKKVTEVFYCDICSEGFKCDMAYITHINSPGHNRKLGMSMKVKNVSLETVSSKISSLISKKLGKKENDQEEDELVIKMENKNGVSGKKRLSQLKRSMGIKNQQQQQNEQQQQEQQQDEQENDNEQGQKGQQIKQQQQQAKLQQQQQQKQQQQQLDSNELAEQEMMMQMGFGTKKQKR